MESPEVQQILSAMKQMEGRLEAKIDSKIDGLRDELTEVIRDLSTETDRRFNELDAKVSGVEQRLDAKIDRAHVEMPTKDFIDRKFADQEQVMMDRAERMFVRR